MAELAQPEILVQVLNTLNPLVKPAPGSGAVQQLQRHVRSLRLSNYVTPNKLDEQQVRVILRACR